MKFHIEANQVDVTIQLSQLETFKALLVRTKEQEQLLTLPERSRVKMQRISNNLVRLVDTNAKMQQLFVEILNQGRVIQSGFSDVLGHFKYDGVGKLRIYDGLDILEFGQAIEEEPEPIVVVPQAKPV